MPSSRNSNERLTLPLNVHPPDTVCFQIEIPNDRGYLAAFYGAIGQLAQWRTWAYDDAHTAKDVAAVWRAIYFALEPNNCRGTPGSAGANGGEDFMLRQNPDNPCLLETSVDGVTWCAWADISKCLSATPSQPTGGGQPNPGECRTYEATLDGNGQWLLPVQVNAGDTIQVTDLSGGWTDGSGQWYCPDGKHYALGTCVGGTEGTSGSDPAPALFHAGLIYQIGTPFYAGYNSSVQTVPPGITNQNAVFQMNDPSLSDNFGNIKFKVKVCAVTALPNTLSYSLGVGPAAFNYGDTLTMTPTDAGGGNFYIDFVASVDVKLTVLSDAGFVQVSGPGTTFSQWFNGGGGTLGSLVTPTNTHLTEFPSPTVVRRWNGGTGAGGATYTLQVRLDHP